jgi:hypothetical protein
MKSHPHTGRQQDNAAPCADDSEEAGCLIPHYFHRPNAARWLEIIFGVRCSFAAVWHSAGYDGLQIGSVPETMPL